MLRGVFVAVGVLAVGGCAFVGGPGSSITGCAGGAPDVSHVVSPGAVSIVALGDFGAADEGRNADVGAALRGFLSQRGSLQTPRAPR